MESEAIKSENKMGVMPVRKLLLSMSLPMMISMLVLAMYNVVDSIFVSKLSEDALTAVSLAFPIQNLMIAIGSGTGVGVNALLSRSLGEKNFGEANNAANNGIFLSLVSYLLFLVFGLFFVRMFLQAQISGPDVENAEAIIAHGVPYLVICSVSSFGLFGQMIMERLLQSTGKTFYTMITQGTGAVINIILDPILIFGYCGMPRMGVAGAAVATVLGQIVGMGMALYFNIAKNKEIQLKLRGFRPRAATIKSIYSVGLPSIIMLSISSVMTFGMNRILIRFGSTANAVFLVYFRLQSFVFMPVFGLNNGMVPIVAYNYGARKKERMIRTIQLSVLYAIVIMLVGLVIFQVFPTQLLSIFNASAYMTAIGTAALRTISLSFLFAGYCIVVSTVFQALGNGILSLIVSVARQLVVLLPAAYLLAGTGNVGLVWWSIPIAELASVTLCTLFMVRIYRRTIRPMDDLPPAPQAG